MRSSAIGLFAIGLACLTVFLLSDEIGPLWKTVGLGCTAAVGSVMLAVLSLKEPSSQRTGMDPAKQVQPEDGLHGYPQQREELESP